MIGRGRGKGEMQEEGVGGKYGGRRLDRRGRRGTYKRWGWGQCVGDSGIKHLQHTERITVHRVSSINSMYSKSYGQKRNYGPYQLLIRGI